MNSGTSIEAIMERFEDCLNRARQLDLREPTAMTLATADAGGRVSARIVLLRGHSVEGFVFFTNSQSDKGRQLHENPFAALCFHWEGLGEQVRIEGRVEVLDDAASDEYWTRRRRASQIGAWASEQSRPLDSRATLEHRNEHFEAEFSGRDVPRPPHWHGYRVVADRIEFWADRDARLHDRDVYVRAGDGSGWESGKLFP